VFLSPFSQGPVIPTKHKNQLILWVISSPGRQTVKILPKVPTSEAFPDKTGRRSDRPRKRHLTIRIPFMKREPATRRKFHLHLISDATGETLYSIAKATCAQFADVQPIEHVYALVRSAKQLTRALEGVKEHPGIVMCTMMNEDLRAVLEEKCRTLNIPCIHVLDQVLASLGASLGTKVTHKTGGQHEMDAEYFRRIEALNFTMQHDDGQMTADLEMADVVLLGVSRTSKTPTCIYLANRGIKAGNIPVVPHIDLPPEVDTLKNPFIIGLVATPDRLIQIRRNRLLSLKQDPETDYVDLQSVRSETAFARQLFARNGWPVIDVTRRSVEETAAAILNLYTEFKENRSSKGEGA
jgi:[pyruvate, water dikinase]-phosphate phosphotransferase / [pyruvate, water dikinase] kinase